MGKECVRAKKTRRLQWGEEGKKGEWERGEKMREVEARPRSSYMTVISPTERATEREKENKSRAKIWFLWQLQAIILNRYLL